MIVAHILNQKGRDVATISPDKTLGDVVAALGSRKIGALVVAESDRRILGIVSERDVVKVLAKSGAAALAEPVVSHMTAKVVSCAPDDSIDMVMQEMTKGRFRHMPVEHEGKLSGIISIGDVVKFRLDQLAAESQALRDYING